MDKKIPDNSYLDDINCFMMSRSHFFLRTLLTGIFFALNCFQVFAQGPAMQVTGTVIDAESKKPLAGASVYLDHTTRATVSSDSGKFVLRGIPSGNYKLVISYVGYNSASVLINEQSPHGFTVELPPAEKLLDEVAIKMNPKWDEYFSLFKMFFLGNGGLQCVIKNPKTLHFEYNDTSYVLTAEAGRPLVIENHALGYRMHWALLCITQAARGILVMSVLRSWPLRTVKSKKNGRQTGRKHIMVLPSILCDRWSINRSRKTTLL